jgi:hypothetical protein
VAHTHPVGAPQNTSGFDQLSGTRYESSRIIRSGKFLTSWNHPFRPFSFLCMHAFDPERQAQHSKPGLRSKATIALVIAKSGAFV